VKKILGVALMCGALLALTLWLLRRGSDERLSGQASAAAASTLLLGTAVPSPSPTTPPAAIPTAAGAGAVSDETTCRHLAELCSTSEQAIDVRECQRKLADARRMAGAGSVEKSTSCLGEARTCAAAEGCLSGGVGTGAVGEFLKGLGGALSK
jgi:hypothetical protein